MINEEYIDMTEPEKEISSMLILKPGLIEQIKEKFRKKKK